MHFEKKSVAPVGVLAKRKLGSGPISVWWSTPQPLNKQLHRKSRAIPCRIFMCIGRSFLLVQFLGVIRDSVGPTSLLGQSPFLSNWQAVAPWGRVGAYPFDDSCPWKEWLHHVFRQPLKQGVNLHDKVRWVTVKSMTFTNSVLIYTLVALLCTEHSFVILCLFSLPTCMWCFWHRRHIADIN